MKTLWLPLLLALAGLLPAISTRGASEPWQDALAAMPLTNNPTLLSRTNTVAVLLGAFQPNATVKGLVLMPGATDELFFFRRVNVPFHCAAPTLLDAVTALTNHTFITATFVPPFLVLHTTEDFLDGFAQVKSPRAEARLKGRTVAERLEFIDCEWDTLQPVLAAHERVNIEPGVGLASSWHFYRHTFVGCNLTQWELLEAVALAGKTRFTLGYWTATYAGDRRHGPIPAPDTIHMAE